MNLFEPPGLLLEMIKFFWKIKVIKEAGTASISQEFLPE